MEVPVSKKGEATGHAVSALFPAMRFSWEIKSVDAVFSNGVARLNDLTKEAMLQAIKEEDLRFLTVCKVSNYNQKMTVNMFRMTATRLF